MSHEWMERLSAYIDGELVSDERGALEAHLAECADCQRTLNELREVVEWARSYEGRAPRNDVWAGVAVGIRHHPHLEPVRAFGISRRWGRRRLTLNVPQAVAAGILFVLVAGGAWWVGRTTAPSAVAPAPVVPLWDASTRPATSATLLQAEKYAAAIAELQVALSVRGAGLDSATIRVLNDKIGVIDRAIADAWNALATDPSSPYLAEHFTRMMRHKLGLLRNAAKMAVVQG